jgi:hypothetical protein
MVGLALGGIVGGWNGGILGGHQADAAEVAGECCLEGCGFMVVGYAFLGIILGAILGAVLGGLGGPLAEFAAPMSRDPTVRRCAGRDGNSFSSA